MLLPEPGIFHQPADLVKLHAVIHACRFTDMQDAIRPQGSHLCPDDIDPVRAVNFCSAMRK